MKKLFFIGALIISAVAFSADDKPTVNEGIAGPMGGRMMMCPMMGGGGNMGMGGQMMMMLTPEQQKAMQQHMVMMQEKHLEMSKAMMEEKVDWDKVEKINKEITEHEAKMRTDTMKYMKEHMSKPAEAPKQ